MVHKSSLTHLHAGQGSLLPNLIFQEKETGLLHKTLYCHSIGYRRRYMTAKQTVWGFSGVFME